MTPAGEKFRSISSGGFHTCALRADGSPVCWGNDERKQASPPAGEMFSSISSGYAHTCALRSDGSPVCWGEGDYEETSPPADENFSAISSGWASTCALRPDGSPICWGGDSDDYPGATPTPEPTPVDIGTTVEVGSSAYTLNEIIDPAHSDRYREVYGEGRRLVALDVTQVGISDAGDWYSPEYIAIQAIRQDAHPSAGHKGFVYTGISATSIEWLLDADFSPLLGRGVIAEGQTVRGWVIIELPELARLVSVLVNQIDVRTPIADFAEGRVGDIASQTPPPVPIQPLAPVDIGTAVKVGGSSYTLHEIMDPVPAGRNEAGEGRRLVALDITQEAISPLWVDLGHFAVQDTDGYVYPQSYTHADVEPAFGSGASRVEPGQIVRGWVTVELPESARLASVLAVRGAPDASESIADLFYEE